MDYKIMDTIDGEYAIWQHGVQIAVCGTIEDAKMIARALEAVTA